MTMTTNDFESGETNLKLAALVPVNRYISLSPTVRFLLHIWDALIVRFSCPEHKETQQLNVHSSTAQFCAIVAWSIQLHGTEWIGSRSQALAACYAAYLESLLSRRSDTMQYDVRDLHHVINPTLKYSI